MKVNYFFKKLVKADNGDEVMAVAGYTDEDTGKYYYAVFPVIGAIGLKGRMIAYHPIVTRELPCVTVEEATNFIDDRIAKSGALFNKELSMYSVTWNSSFIGTITNDNRGNNIMKSRVAISYDGGITHIQLPTVYSFLDDKAVADKIRNYSVPKTMGIIIGNDALDLKHEDIPYEFIG